MDYAVNCSILLTELPVNDRPGRVKAVGFDAVEFWWPFASAVPPQADVDAFVNAITNAGVQLTGLNFFAGDMSAGDRGLLSWPDRSDEFRDNIDVVVEIGGQLGCKSYNALYGNRIDGVDPAEQDELALHNLALAANALAPIGGTVLLEPVSGAPAYPLRTAGDAFEVIAKVREADRIDNIKLLADFYHLAVNGDDVDKVIANHAAEFGHIQIADAPGRGEPGTGELPLAEWIEASIAGGYAGHIGLEYRATSAAPFAWAIEERPVV